MAINVKDKLVTLESLGVAYSAEQDAREEADQALSTRIDNIVAPEGDPSLTEVSDARVSGSTTYNTLKARLDADKAAIGTEISQLSADLGAVSDGSFSTEEKRSMLFYILRHALYDADLTSIINTLESAMQGADTPYTILQRCALDGTQYVDTGLSSELDECTVETTIIRTVDDTKARCILASNNTIYPQLRKTSANGRHVMIKNRGAAMDVGTFDWTTGEPYTLKYDVATNKVTVNGTDIISSVSDGETPSSANYTLFASGANVSASDNRFIGYFYGLKVSKNGQVIHEYKPAKRNLDNRIGILDTVTMTFSLSATNYDILEG